MESEMVSEQLQEDIFKGKNLSLANIYALNKELYLMFMGNKLTTLQTLNPELINNPDALGITPLMYTAVKGHSNFVTFLLNNKADIFLKTRENQSIFELLLHMINAHQ